MKIKLGKRTNNSRNNSFAQTLGRECFFLIVIYCFYLCLITTKSIGQSEIESDTLRSKKRIILFLSKHRGKK